MLTQERVRELFDLDYETGILTRKIKTNNCVKVGDSVGSITKAGYVETSIEGQRYYVHRVIYLYVHGYTPEGEIDHISRDRSDNRPCNLREATRVCNLRNTPTPVTNTSGVKGVQWYKAYNKWTASVHINRKHRGLGYHKDFTEAVAHRLAAEQALDWAGCDSNSPAFQYMQNYLKSLNSELSEN